jgi:hypothetical protein
MTVDLNAVAMVDRCNVRTVRTLVSKTLSLIGYSNTGDGSECCEKNKQSNSTPPNRNLSQHPSTSDIPNLKNGRGT